MSKCAIIAGFGSGNSYFVAKKFAQEGFSVACASLELAHAEEPVARLKEEGFTAHALQFEAADPASVKAMVKAAKEALGGPISFLYWNPTAGAPLKKSGMAAFAGGNLLTTTPEEFLYSINVHATGLIMTVQELVEDLKATKGAIIANQIGMAADMSEKVTDMIQGMMPLGMDSCLIGKVAQYKACVQLNGRLKGDGVYVGQVNIMKGPIKFSELDPEGTNPGALDPVEIADAAWKLFDTRAESNHHPVQVPAAATEIDVSALKK